MARAWKPCKIYRKPGGDEVLFTRHVESRELRKEPFEVLEKFGDIARGGLPTYRENPKYIEYFSHEAGRKVPRRPQVGDVVHVEGLRFGECIVESSGSQTAELRVQPRQGDVTVVPTSALTVVHHNIVGMGNKDHENRLQECRYDYRTVEELEFAERLCHESALDWILSQSEDVSVDVALVKTLHENLMGRLFDWAGEYRTTDLWVGPEDFETTAPRFIVPRMAQFDDNLTEREARLETLTERQRAFWLIFAQIYLDLCEIHPFRDGNGRVSRLLLTVLLFKYADRPAPLDWSSLKRATNKTDRAFPRARRRDELTPLARLVQRAYRKSASQLGFDVSRWSELDGGQPSSGELPSGDSRSREG